MGGLTAVLACLPGIYAGGCGVVGFMAAMDGHERAEEMVVFGGVMAVVGVVWIVLSWLLAGCIIVAGRKLETRKSYTFCLVVAVVQAVLLPPLGTVLGILTIAVLVRPSVKTTFEIGTAWSAAQAPRRPW